MPGIRGRGRGPWAWAGALGFACFLATPLLGQLAFPSVEASRLENRALAPSPELSDAVTSWPGFPGRVSAWLEDRFGFRRELLALYLWLDHQLETDIPRLAVVGEDGWMYAAVDFSLLAHEGRRPFAPGEAEAWLDTLSAMDERVRAAGGTFIVLVVPDKQTVYPEHLPAYPRRIPGESRRETLARLASERGLALIDPLPDLRAAKPWGQLYYYSDSHWTDRGAYVAYRALADELRARGFPLTPVGEERLVWREDPEFRGDLYRLLGVEPPAETIERAAIEGGRPDVEIRPLPELAWSVNDINPRSLIKAGEGGPSMLIVGDSFAGALLPYLGETFDVITLAHHRMGAVPLEKLDLASYDVVVLEVVERFLNLPPATPAE